MKKALVLLIFSLFIVECSERDSENTMHVTGNIKGLKKGTLYLQKIQDSTLLTIDSLSISGNGNFSFKTDIESPEIFYLYLKKADNNDINDRITFFGEPGTLKINTFWDNFDTKASVEGSEANKKLEEFRKVISRFNKENLEISNASYNLEFQGDSLVMDSLQQKINKSNLRAYLYALNFALNNKHSYIAPYIALTEVANANPKFLDSIYNALPTEVADSKYGRALGKHIQELKSAGAE